MEAGRRKIKPACRPDGPREKYGSSATHPGRHPLLARTRRAGLFGRPSSGGDRVAARRDYIILGRWRWVFEMDVLGNRDDHPSSGVWMVRVLGRRGATPGRWNWEWVDDD